VGDLREKEDGEKKWREGYERQHSSSFFGILERGGKI